MNRIVLIGNGFDRAHVLKTNYEHFIDWLFAQEAKKIVESNNENDNFDGTFIRIQNLNYISGFRRVMTYSDMTSTINQDGGTLYFKNKFLEKITQHKRTFNWVDIENEYYQILLKIISVRDNADKRREFTIDGIYFNDYTIDKLNTEFHQIREKLIKYLGDEIEKEPTTVIDAILRHLESIFQYNEFPKAIMVAKVEEELEKFNKLSSEIDQNTARLNEIEELLIEKVSSIDPKRAIEFQLKNPDFKLIDYLELRPKDILLLNFNYTSTHAEYIPRLGEEEIGATVNHIHGDLKNIEENPIIFGFGDELDEKYKEIENINDNRYLENIKSIEYLQTDSYKKLLNYIESDKYQIFIMGHSCGLSDRTLLNTLFEHENCVSIKPFFYEYKDDKGKQVDNYKEITQNISRNFKDKRKMREIVVNKKFCKKLS